MIFKMMNMTKSTPGYARLFVSTCSIRGTFGRLVKGNLQHLSLIRQGGTDLEDKFEETTYTEIRNQRFEQQLFAVVHADAVQNEHNDQTGN